MRGGYNAPQPERDAEMVRLYLDGVTLDEVGDIYGITRERVRQVVYKAGYRAKDGGAAVMKLVKQERKETQRQERYEARCQRIYRCSSEIVDSLGGCHAGWRQDGTPTAAYFNQYHMMAGNYGARWELTLPQWWDVWKASGKWSQRGRGRGHYVLARIDKTGPFAVGNVHIVEHAQNSLNTRGWVKANERTREIHRLSVA